MSGFLWIALVIRSRSCVENTNDCVTSSGTIAILAPDSNTTLALAGSKEMLNSAVGVTFHHTKDHHMIIILSTCCKIQG
jgi:hypothetical protein